MGCGHGKRKGLMRKECEATNRGSYSNDQRAKVAIESQSSVSISNWRKCIPIVDWIAAREN
jgi:hypothetical protein